MWHGHRYKEPVVQVTYAMWALGAAIGPLIIGCFLVDLPPKDIAKDVVNWTSESSVLEAAGIIQTTLQGIATVVDLHII